MLSGSIFTWHPCIHAIWQFNPWYPSYPAVSSLAFMLSGSFTPGICYPAVWSLGIHAIWQYYPLVSTLSSRVIPWYPCNRVILSTGIHAVWQYYPLVSIPCGSTVLSPGIHAICSSIVSPDIYAIRQFYNFYPLVSMLSGSIIPRYIHAIRQYYPLVSMPSDSIIPGSPATPAEYSQLSPQFCSKQKMLSSLGNKKFLPPPLPPPLGHRVWPAAQSLLSPNQEFAKIVCKIYLSSLCLLKFRKISVFPSLSCAFLCQIIMKGSIRGPQRDVVYLCWPKPPS